MPNLNNAKKAVRVINKKKEENSVYKASMKSAMKQTEKAISSNDKKLAEESLKNTIVKIDKAASKGVVKKNFAARNKSRLTKKVNEMA